MIPQRLGIASFALLSLILQASCTDMPSGPGGTARLTTTPPGLSFGVKEAGAPDVIRIVTVTNEGSAASEPLDITIEGTGAASFDLLEGTSTCIGLELARGATCTVAVSFGGQAVGPQSATLFIDAGQGQDRATVTLNGILQAP